MVFEAILNRAPVSAARLNPELIPDLGWIAAKLLEKDRKSALPVGLGTSGRPQAGQARHGIFRSANLHAAQGSEAMHGVKPAIIAAVVVLLLLVASSCFRIVGVIGCWEAEVTFTPSRFCPS